MSNRRKQQRQHKRQAIPTTKTGNQPKVQNSVVKLQRKTPVDYLLPMGEPPNGRLPSVINPEYFLARPGDVGLRPSLASQFCDILIAAQHFFGERDYSYTFLGFEFVNGAPRLLRQYDGKYLIIQLYLNAAHDSIKAYSQIAHECIHMLSPCDRDVSILEEGLAYFFSNWYILKNFGVMPPQSELQSYDNALDLVDVLMCSDAYGIKKIRQEQPMISKITNEQILRYYPTISEEVASKLIMPFDRR
jgi:hypothetical protein